MHVRAIALALPLAIGIGCRTTHTRSPETASVPSRSDTATSSSTAQPGTMGRTPEDPIKGHVEDRTVSGTVSGVAEGQITIESGMGQQEALQVVPQTVVTIDGREGTLAEVQEGQQVRASYSDDQAGLRTAVKIEVGEPSRAGEPTPGMGPSPDAGTAPRTPDLSTQPPPEPPATTIPPVPKSDG